VTFLLASFQHYITVKNNLTSYAMRRYCITSKTCFDGEVAIMLNEHPSQVLAWLCSGRKVAIGGESSLGKADLRKATPSPTQLVLGFAAIYLIWGSTYLGIRYAVETIPPLLMMGMRHLVAGAVVYAWARWRGARAPQLKHWGYALIAGALLFLGGHGILAWAEQRVPSGLAALLCATLPLWTVLLARIDGTEGRVSMRALGGILLGCGGVALLIGPDMLGQRLGLLAVVGTLSSTLLWAVGTAYTRRVRMPDSTLLSAAMQMLSGGTLLLLTGLFTGETSGLHLADVTTRSVLSLVYLIVLGSIVAFSVYTWLVSASSPSMLSTYAYVNPVIAVFLGWVFAGEALGARTMVATAVIIAGVILVSTRRTLAPVVEANHDIPHLQQACEATGD
jgi:drug/metabolite transporter (DMT)-like permease